MLWINLESETLKVYSVYGSPSISNLTFNIYVSSTTCVCAIIHFYIMQSVHKDEGNYNFKVSFKNMFLYVSNMHC